MTHSTCASGVEPVEANAERRDTSLLEDGGLDTVLLPGIEYPLPGPSDTRHAQPLHASTRCPGLQSLVRLVSTAGEGASFFLQAVDKKG